MTKSMVLASPSDTMCETVTADLLHMPPLDRVVRGSISFQLLRLSPLSSQPPAERAPITPTLERKLQLWGNTVSNSCKSPRATKERKTKKQLFELQLRPFNQKKISLNTFEKHFCAGQGSLKSGCLCSMRSS